MYALLVSASLFAAAPDDKPKPEPGATPAISLDGNWTVLCAEKDGKPMPDAKNMTVTAKGDTITCGGKDGKPTMTMKVEFMPGGKIKIMETSAGGASDKPTAKVGVYVLTSDFLSLCVHDAGEKGATAEKESNKCTFVLQRSGASRP